jgi:hypothetical protein
VVPDFIQGIDENDDRVSWIGPLQRTRWVDKRKVQEIFRLEQTRFDGQFVYSQANQAAFGRLDLLLDPEQRPVEGGSAEPLDFGADHFATPGDLANSLFHRQLELTGLKQARVYRRKLISKAKKQ